MIIPVPETGDWIEWTTEGGVKCTDQVISVEEHGVKIKDKTGIVRYLHWDWIMLANPDEIS